MAVPPTYLQEFVEGDKLAGLEAPHDVVDEAVAEEETLGTALLTRKNSES